jgi:D-xylose transport system substrate-binding protein
VKPRTTFLAAIAATSIIVSACSSAATPAPATPAPATPAPATAAPSAPASAAPAASAPAAVPSVSVSSFDNSFSFMSQLKGLTAAGKGLVGVILPDTTSSARYVDFDAPYLQQAFAAAGYAPSDFKIDNAQGNDATELALAQADITLGAKVLVMDPLDSTVGDQIQSLASAAGVTLISYDRATFKGTNTYYVSFDNVQVGKLIGKGFMDCVTAWGVKNPMVFELDGGEDTDPNAISFAQGYNSVIWGQEKTPLSAGITNSAGYKLVGEQITPGWNNTTGGTIFQQQFTAHPEINATVEANDGLGNAVITVLKAKGIPAKHIPTTGQDATLQGMENILQGYQCGSVYKPIYLEAQAAVALATILRAGQTPPSSLVNGTTTDPANASITEPAVLLTPVWVNASNMADTVIKDNFVSASALCSAVGASVCSANNIKP